MLSLRPSVIIDNKWASSLIPSNLSPIVFSLITTTGLTLLAYLEALMIEIPFKISITGPSVSLKPGESSKTYCFLPIET